MVVKKHANDILVSVEFPRRTFFKTALGFQSKSLPTPNFFHNKQIHVLRFKPLKGHTPVLLVQRRTHFKQLVFSIWSSRECASQKQQYHSFMYKSCKQGSHSNLIDASQKAARKEIPREIYLVLFYEVRTFRRPGHFV